MNSVMKSLQASRAFLVFSFLSSIDMLSTRLMCSMKRSAFLPYSIGVSLIGLAIIIPPIFVDFRISAAKLRFSFEKTMLYDLYFCYVTEKSCQVDGAWQLSEIFCSID